MYEHFKQLCDDREYIIKKIFKGKQDNSVTYPVSFTRIITNTHALYQKYKVNNVPSDLDPIFVLDEIDRLCEELFITENNRGNTLLQMLSRMYLSPKQMVIKYGFNRTAFEQIVEMVKMRYYDSIVNPSEMVGVVAAQSIGEPATQINREVCKSSSFKGAASGCVFHNRNTPKLQETPYVSNYHSFKATCLRTTVNCRSQW